MRTGAIVACVGLALMTGGCNTLDGTYLREGVGTEVASVDAVTVTNLQEIYFGELCRQAGLNVRQTPEGALFCDEATMSPAAWTIFVQAGMNDIDRRCDAYLAWLDDRRRWREPALKQLHSTAAATAAIMGLSGVGAVPIAIVGAAFGFAQETFVNFSGRLITEINHSTVQSIVLTRQNDYRGGLTNKAIPNRPAALYALRSYLRLCMPMTIETEINTTLTSVDRNGTAPPPMITPATIDATVRAGTIANARETPIERFKPKDVDTGSLFAAQVQDSLCVRSRTKKLDATTEDAIESFLVGTQDRKAADRAPVNITKAIRVVLNRAIRLVPDCRQAGFLGPFEVGRFGIVSAAERKMLVAEMQDSLRAKLGVSAQDLPSDGDINQPATRNAISKLRTVAPAINPELGSAIDAPILARIFAR